MIERAGIALSAGLVAGVLVASCGGDDEDGSASTDGGEIAIEAGSDEDRRIGEDLVAYFDRNLQSTPSDQASFDRACESPDSPRVQDQCDQARAVLDAYGTIESVEVGDGAITIRTGIDPAGDEAAVAGQGLCDLIQGADVADFTSGSSVLGEGDEEITACEARTAP